MRTTFAVVLALITGSVLAGPEAECAPVEYVYARATTEPPQGIKEGDTLESFHAAAAKYWSKGYGAAGASLWSNLTSNAVTKIDGIVGYPVPYPVSSLSCFRLT
jgi:hypothetical protein